MKVNIRVPYTGLMIDMEMRIPYTDSEIETDMNSLRIMDNERRRGILRSYGL